MTTRIKAALLFVAALVLLLGGWLTGRSYEAATTGRKVAECRADHQTYVAQEQAAKEAAARALLQSYQEAQAHADTLTRQLAAARQAAAKLKKERQREIERHVNNSPCFNDPALRLLDGSPGVRVELSDAAGGTAGADAARVATAADLGRWIPDAGERYAECTRRLDALIDWIEGRNDDGGASL